jgi:hypothetical protein
MKTVWVWAKRYQRHLELRLFWYEGAWYLDREHFQREIAYRGPLR